jgi:FKBP-type peptidyl-prolyl cis-trans isomerase
MLASFLGLAINVSRGPVVDDGIVRTVISQATGRALQPGDRVTIAFSATTGAGKELASSLLRGLSYTMVLGSSTNDSLLDKLAISMSEGEEDKFECTAAAAYGTQGCPPFVAPNTDLEVDIRIIAVVRQQEAKRAPSRRHR